jgi:hypothetical protein
MGANVSEICSLFALLPNVLADISIEAVSLSLPQTLHLFMQRLRSFAQHLSVLFFPNSAGTPNGETCTVSQSNYPELVSAIDAADYAS